MDDMLNQMLGVNLKQLRYVWMSCMGAVGVLYLYRLVTIVRCMRAPLDTFKTPFDRLIWVGLAIMVPLGLGAYLYDIVQARRPLRLMFILPALVILYSATFFGVPLLLKSNNLTFDFMGL